MKKAILVIGIFALVLLAGCNTTYYCYDECVSGCEQESHFNNGSNNLIFSNKSIESPALLIVGNINTSTPFINVNCDWLLNKSNVVWKNLNLTLTKSNKSIDIDVRELCNELKGDYTN